MAMNAREIVERRLDSAWLNAVIKKLKEGREADELILKYCESDEDFAHDFCNAGGHFALRDRLAAGDEMACAIVAATSVSFPASMSQERRRPPERFTLSKDFELWIRFVAERQSAQADTGYILWPAALILARWLQLNPEFVQNQHVIELGAGVGLSGLACLNLEPKTLQLTDSNQMCLRNLEYNLRLNACKYNSPQASVEFLDFYTHTHKTQIDRILASDIICCVDDAKALARFLAFQLTPHTGKAVILLADSRNRWGVDAFPSELSSLSSRITFSATKLRGEQKNNNNKNDSSAAIETSHTGGGGIKMNDSDDYDALLLGLDDERQYLDWTLFQIDAL